MLWFIFGGDLLKNRRLGNFRFSDYWGSWVACLLYFGMAIACTAVDLHIFFVVLPLIYCSIRIWTIISPHFERFALNDKEIVVSKFKKERTIPLPDKLTVILSYADVCPPLSVHLDNNNQTHILKDKISVSILQEMTIEFALHSLHKTAYTKKYTMSDVEHCFDPYRFVYSFVFNADLFAHLLDGRECLVIVPESLVEKLSLHFDTADFYVDKGF